MTIRHAIHVEQILREHGIPYREHGAELWTECPWCHSQDGVRTGTASVNAESGAFNCKHENSCGQRASFRQLLEKHGIQSAAGEAARRLQPAFVHRPPKQYRRPEPPAPAERFAGEVSDYLRGRGLSPETIKAFRVVATVRNGSPAIAMPFYDSDGSTLFNTKYRIRDGERPRWKNFQQEKDSRPGLFGKHLAPESGPQLVIVEGELDCLSAYQLGRECEGPPVVSVPSGAGNLDWIEVEFSWLEGFDQIVIATDADDAGEKAAGEIARRLGIHRCSRLEMPHKDLNEWLQAGLDADTYLFAIREAREYRPQNLKSAAEFEDAVLYSSEEDQERERGVPTSLESLDRMLGRWRPAETTVITGLNGSGKSTFLYQTAVDLVRRKQRVCIASLETRPALYLRRMVAMAAGATASIETKRQAWSWLAPGLWILDIVATVKPSDLVDVFDYSARRYGVGFCITDSLMRLDVAEDDYAGQAGFIRRVQDEICNRHGVHHLLVCHPRKGMSDATTGRDRVSVRGTAVLTDLAHNVLGVSRETDPEDGHQTNELRVMKNRELGTCGTIPLWFAPEAVSFTDRPPRLRQAPSETGQEWYNR